MKNKETVQKRLFSCGATFVMLLTFTGCVMPPLPTTATPNLSSPERTAGIVAVNGITIAYESFGPPDDATILLIAGTGMQLVNWPIELVTELVQRGYRVVRFDNRDIGLSTMLREAGLPDAETIGKALAAGEPAPAPYTRQEMAADAVGSQPQGQGIIRMLDYETE